MYFCGYTLITLYRVKNFLENLRKYKKNLDKKMIINNMSEQSLILLKGIILSIVLLVTIAHYKKGGYKLSLSIYYISITI